MRSASRTKNDSSPTADLMPTGNPVVVASNSTKSSSESSSVNAVCDAGLTQSTPTGMPRISATSGVIFAAGSSPPRPGFAPCDTLISMERIVGLASTTSMRRGREKLPEPSRHPK